VKVVIAGGSGHLGTLLASARHQLGDEVVVLSRAPGRARWRVVAWDARTAGPWARELDGADVVVNLAGRSVNCRYTTANKRAIMDSRVDSVRAIGAAIAAAAIVPKLWLQMSTATIYAHRYDEPNDEARGIIGGSEAGTPPAWRFSIEVARAWERAVDESASERTRTVKLRTAVVMSPEPGGPFDLLLRLVRFGLGGASGDGKQMISWIHNADFVRAIDWIVRHEDVSGVVNLAAPKPLPNAAFMRALRRAWGIPIGLPAPAWMLEIGTRLLRTESELVLKSRFVVPGVLEAGGFAFDFPEWDAAARDLCARSRRAAGPLAQNSATSPRPPAAAP
jgi:uncharacterized protein (TIGR01777 family)